MSGNITGTPFNNLTAAYPELYPVTFIDIFYAGSIIDLMTNDDFNDAVTGPGAVIHLRYTPQIQVLPGNANGDCRWSPVVVDQTTFTIDYLFDAAYQILDIEQAKMDVATEAGLQTDMVNKLRLAAESTFLGSIYASAFYQITGMTGTNKEWDYGTNCLSYIAKAAANLSTGVGNGVDVVPRSERYLAIHPQMVPALVQQQALWALNMGTPKGAQYEGYVGHINGFDVLESPLIVGSGTAASPYHAIAGHPKGVTFGTKFSTLKSGIPLVDKFGTGTRCQQFFGFKATKTNFLVDMETVLIA